MSGLEIRRLGSGDQALVRAAADLFDDAPDEAETERFLHDPLHYLLIAHVDGTAVGFVSGTRVFHPDKPPEMFLNELGVAEAARNRGTGRALVEALARAAAADGCREMWVLTSPDNLPAMAVYRNAGGALENEEQVMFTFHLFA